MIAENVARLLEARRTDSPTELLGLAEAPMALGEAVDRAAARAHTLLADGLVPGEPVALVGETRTTGSSPGWRANSLRCPRR